MNTEILASQLADDYICQCCLDRFVVQLGNSLHKDIQHIVGKDTTEQPDSYPHAEFFTALFKALDPYEKKWVAMLQGIWGEEEKIIVANLKKLKKAYMSKDDSDIVDSVLYPKGMFENKLSEKARTIDLLILSKQGALEMERIGVTDIAFNMENPEVQKWLKEYIPKFSKKLEDVSVERLRRELLAGLKAGEGIPELTKRVNTTYAHWNKVRSEMIARTETLRASNRAALEAYKQSGVVKKKQWVTQFDKRTCPWCEQMDGKIVGIETSFFDQGDEFTVSPGGKDQTLKLDYEEVASPPLHTLCRCAIVAYFE